MTLPALPRVLPEDRTLPHQVVLRLIPDPRPHHGGLALAVSCTCAPYTLRSQHGGPAAYEPIASRMPFPAAEAIAAWRAWHAEKGVAV